MENTIKRLLDEIVHPETGEGIVRSGIVERVALDKEKISVALRFKKARDPFALKIKNQVLNSIREHFPAYKDSTTVVVIEGEKQSHPQEQPKRTSTANIAHIIAVASGKGGVGKSTVTANLSLTLRNMGFRTGILDADIYGPSQPKMFHCEDYVPDAERDTDTGVDYILPALKMDIKLMSIGFFIKPTDALMWRGAMATNALKQMIHQTKWGALDFLLIDMPPGTGDIHLSILSELNLSGAVIVSTPQQVAVADVVRGVEMFRHPQVNVPVLGIIENMAFFTPAELPDNRYYLFGRGGAREYAAEKGIDFLGEIPIIQSVMEGSEDGEPAVLNDSRVEEYYRKICSHIVENVMKSC